MNTELERIIRIAPETWPGKPLRLQPGDLAHFVPSGLGLEAPAVMSPWDTLEGVANRGGYYGFTQPSLHPFLNAPVNDACAGTVYFDDNPTHEQLDALFGLLEVRDRLTGFAAFWQQSTNPRKERYLEQLRIVSQGALGGIFHAEIGEEHQALLNQKLTMKEALWAFLENQQKRYPRDALHGTMGGDGDWAKETLGFGFMVENSYQRVYRIWSRAWLLTK